MEKHYFSLGFLFPKILYSACIYVFAATVMGCEQSPPFFDVIIQTSQTDNALPLEIVTQIFEYVIPNKSLITKKQITSYKEVKEYLDMYSIACTSQKLHRFIKEKYIAPFTKNLNDITVEPLVLVDYFTQEKKCISFTLKTNLAEGTLTLTPIQFKTNYWHLLCKTTITSFSKDNMPTKLGVLLKKSNPLAYTSYSFLHPGEINRTNFLSTIIEQATEIDKTPDIIFDILRAYPKNS